MIFIRVFCSFCVSVICDDLVNGEFLYLIVLGGTLAPRNLALLGASRSVGFSQP